MNVCRHVRKKYFGQTFGFLGPFFQFFAPSQAFEPNTGKKWPKNSQSLAKISFLHVGIPSCDVPHCIKLLQQLTCVFRHYSGFLKLENLPKWAKMTY